MIRPILVLALASVFIAGCFGAAHKSQEPSPASSPPPTWAPPSAAPTKIPQRPLPAPVDLFSGNSKKTLSSVKSFDGHMVPITLYRPVEATSATRVPLLLHSHGFGGSRATADDVFRDYHKAGFGVLSIDMRGHGEARTTSAARIHDMDFEIKDVKAVVDYVATLDWVAGSAPGDPLIGGLGGSYGGAYQLLIAAVDPRVDAIAPNITWNNLLDSLAPGGVPRSAWIDLFYLSGNAQARLDPEIHQGYAVALSQNRIPDGSVPGEPNLKAQFLKSSASSYPVAIRIPTFLMQGINDTLFNFNQAVANYLQIRATGAPVFLWTHLGGHILNTRGTLPGNAPAPAGLQPPTGPSPCGNLTRATIAFYQNVFYRIPVAIGSGVCLALDDGTSVSGPEYPLPGTEMRPFQSQASLLVPQGAATPQPPEVPLFTAKEPTVVAGIPLLSGKITTTSPDAIVYYEFKIVHSDGSTQIANSQVTPQRVTSTASGKAFELPLAGLGIRLHKGDALVLVATNVQEQFAHNGERVPGLATISDLSLRLPVVASTPRVLG
jgi:pimeloyl-ACP methyl ester carboxylesterase